jgi:Predicted aminopeptidases
MKGLMATRQYAIFEHNKIYSMRHLLLVTAIICSLAATGQKIANPKPFANSITADNLKKHLYILAGPEMEGRETATEGQRKAAAYIENHFKALGLLPGDKGNYQMYFPVFQDSIVHAGIEVNGQSFEAGKDFMINMSASYTSTMLASEVVFVGYGFSDSTRDDYRNLNTLGKIVLILPGAPPAQTGTNGHATRYNPYAIAEAAQKNGAVAILMVNSNFPRPSYSGKGSQYIHGFRKSILPNIYQVSEQVAKAIMGADYETVAAAMKAGNHVTKTYQANVRLDFHKQTSKLNSSNVIGVLEGTDKKDEYVFITAHYDHLGKRGDSVIYFGADDDASGTSALLEMAEAFVKAKAAGKGPRRTMVFMAVSGEEKGLWGSAYYSDNAIFPLEKTTVDLNIDMIGRIDPKRKKGDSTNYVYVVGDDKLSSDLRPISEAMNKKYTKLELDYKYNAPDDPERIYYRSDHYNFARKGVPIIFYFNGTHNDYHRPTDTPDKINYDLMTKRTKLIFYTAWEMANRNDMLKRDIPLDQAE